MKLEDIQSLIKLIDETSIDEFVYEFEGVKVKIKKHEYSVVREEVVRPVVTNPAFSEAPKAVHTEPVIEKVEVDDSVATITAPMVGTFYRASGPDASNFVEVGAAVKEKSVVCILEAMKLFNEIEAECTGEIIKIHVENGQLVEFGQPLFTVKLKG